MPRNFTHFTRTDRIRLETMLRDGIDKPEIAERLQKHLSNVYREIKRGEYQHTLTDLTTQTRYSSDLAEQRYRAHLAAKGADLKIGNDRELADAIEAKIIKEKFAPAPALAALARSGKFVVNFCVSTLYHYIDKGIFLKLTNKHLPVKRNNKGKYRKIQPKRAPKGESIEKRPEAINARTTFGHWEMDTVKGKRDTANTLLVLTERLTREEIKVRLPDNTDDSVVKALDRLERRYGQMFPKVFNSITVDNGSEFQDCAGMERSIYGGQRTKCYYCHPYSSYERGSNENQNKLIRRWIPKGTPIEQITDEMIAFIQDWINNYPRKLFDWATSAERFAQHMAELTANA
ncbi:IS30 family transposase [Clostridia bacterium]|nr:IS30 family transposase [Clostridia bacterium]